MAKPTVETRTVSATFEMRSDGPTPTLEGYAATFGQPYQVGPFHEVIDSGAFARTLGRQPDVRLLVDHEGQPLARTKSGTLQLAPDSTGLHVRAALDSSDPDVQRLLPKMRRGDLDQMSFAFRVPRDGDEWDSTFTQRTLRHVDLEGGDVSVVTYPANENTSVAVRTRDLRSAICAKADVMYAALREMRAGAEFSQKNVTELKRLLDLIAAADDSIDAAQAGLADLLGVPNPDADDADQPDDMMQMNSADRIVIGARAVSDEPARLALGLDSRAAMATADINDLPDSDFAYIEPGGEKDSEGKTVPRSLRHFPIHDAEHVRNALARAPQSPFGEKAMPKILAAAKKFGIDVNNKNSRPLTLAQATATALSL